jgi:hypothetical protein
MDGYQFTNHQGCTLVFIAFAAIIIVSQVYSVSPVFASFSNETGTQSSSVGAFGKGPLSCAPQDSACTVLLCDSQTTDCSANAEGEDECNSLDASCGTTRSTNTGDGTKIPTEGQCDSQDSSCSTSATSNTAKQDQCDSQDSSCSTDQDQTLTPVPEQLCGDGIDNDSDGQIDAADKDCGSGGGGIPTPSFPGGGGGPGAPPHNPVPPQEENPSTVGDANNGGGGSTGHNILITSFPSNILIPVQVKLVLPREDICNDGRDNNHNGLVDYEDQTCGPLETPRPTFSGSHSLSKLNPRNESETIPLERYPSSGVSPSNTIEIRILGGGNHDIRTVSFLYKYSQDKFTIKDGTKVVWINEDPAGPRGINLIDTKSGKTVFSYPVIPFKSSANYTIGEPGRYVYSDIKRSALTGEIIVVG